MNLSDAKILVVEDDPLMRTFVVNTLQRMGVVNVKECGDGTAALRAVPSFQPDLILTDIHMKPMDGLDFVSKLRNLPGATADHRKVIFMSADSSRETLGAALPLGVSAYIVKPPRLADLKSKIENALREA
jgi:two-component system chemotaxis response regulator CheY